MKVVLTPLSWDSEKLGLPCASLRGPWPTRPEAMTAAVVEALSAAASAALVVAKTPVGICDPAALQGALPSWTVQALGVEVVHVRPPGEPTADSPDETTFFSNALDPTPFLELAWDMHFSRYHLDAAIGSARAVSLWRASITEHCLGFAQEVAVAKHHGRPAGLATLHLEAEAVRLHIVGVLAWARGQGVGRRLLEAVIARHGRARALLVEAHAGNRAAAALYGAVGCRPTSRHDVLHFWNKRGLNGDG
ncbi:GNAT family N-acetyltransferase [Solidesulfovibrio magneticus]|uniref:N-acetyltransferase domain-containing protein n=1 Tax=Solidesulfovibrio magneticus (strain ATCC 700980 / DSM 13731 / RS-1) TaxID=573370 RepID=C4XP29_SOLM1|nr:GNAT family N-acetyltransferase [Solidesulfovibrio magneticus]BAH77530.1 hypothetical protein DMR_40390 [Solidesulfovibrio magneticus RS-1]